MPFNLNIIIATAGRGRCQEHAAANVAIVNEANPTLIFVSPLHVDPGARLERLVAWGDFVECTLGDYIAEEIAFLKQLRGALRLPACLPRRRPAPAAKSGAPCVSAAST